MNPRSNFLRFNLEFFLKEYLEELKLYGKHFLGNFGGIPF